MQPYNPFPVLRGERPRPHCGYVGWRPGELKAEIERGLWSVLSPDVDTVFRKEMEGLWEELLQQTRRIRAEGSTPLIAFVPY